MKAKRNHNKKTIAGTIIITVVLAIMLAAAITVYSAYVSRGNFKDILISGLYYFNSNILRTNDDTVFTSYSSSQDITVYNYGTSNDINTVDVVYEISFSINGELNENYKYYVTYNGTESEITSNELIISGESLYRSTRSVHLYTLSCENQIPNELGVTQAAGIPNTISVTATPTSPDYMTTSIITRKIGFSSNVFSVEGSFDVTLTDEETLNKYGGFIYRITKAGNPASNQEISVTWDSAQLTLSKNCVLPTGVTVTDNGDNTASIVFSHTEALNTLTFFRVLDDPTTVDITEGFNAGTVGELNGLVTITTYISSE